MKEFPVIKRMGEHSILIEFEPVIREDLLVSLLKYKNVIKEKSLKQTVEVINTYNSLLITYESTIDDFYGVKSELEELFGEANIQNNFKPVLFHVPVCYEENFALDLEYLSAEKSISKSEIIELHTAPVYTIYFIGFLPGFLYLGGLDEKLHFPRKNQPRLSVEKGAVGIGEKQTGIYPKISPGGWQIIGNSPVPLFDKNVNPPCEISPGDKIRFYPVDIQEHQRISEEVRNGNFKFRKEDYEG